MNTSSDKDLGRKAAAGLTWKFSSIAANTVVNFGIGVVLARLLPPEDFGLIGLAWIVVGFAELFVSLGLGPALIQKKELNERHIRVGFTLSLVMSLVMAAAVYLIAPWGAVLLRDSRVTPILQVLCGMFVVRGMGVTSRALLSRRLAFRPLFIISLAGAVGYGVLATVLAFTGFGVWSLVYGSLLQAAIGTGLSFGYARHSVRPLASRGEFQDLAAFGAGISLASVFNYVARKGDYFIAGRLLGPAPLGLYTRAFNLMSLPTSAFVQGLGSVLFPVMSKMQDQPARFRGAYINSMSVMAFGVIPLMAFVVILAPEIIIGIYGDNWAGAVAPLQILGLFGAFGALYNGTANFVRARGWVYHILGCQVIYGTCVLGGGWIATSLWGIKGLAWAVGLSVLIMWGLMSHLGNRASQIGWSTFLVTLRPGFVLGGLIGLPCALTRWTLLSIGMKPLPILAICMLAGATTGIAGVLLLPQAYLNNVPRSIYRRLMEIVPEHLNRSIRKICWFLNAPTLRF